MAQKKIQNYMQRKRGSRPVHNGSLETGSPSFILLLFRYCRSANSREFVILIFFVKSRLREYLISIVKALM